MTRQTSSFCYPLPNSSSFAIATPPHAIYAKHHGCQSVSYRRHNTTVVSELLYPGIYYVLTPLLSTSTIFTDSTLLAISAGKDERTRFYRNPRSLQCVVTVIVERKNNGAATTTYIQY
jgi:hypothetical protein